MSWHQVLYALACVAVPIAWGLVIVWASNRLDRRLLNEDPAHPSRSRSIEYHI